MTERRAAWEQIRALDARLIDANKRIVELETMSQTLMDVGERLRAQAWRFRKKGVAVREAMTEWDSAMRASGTILAKR